MRPHTDSLLDTIAALATPAGRSAVALVRLSGRDTRALLAKVAPGLPEPPVPRRATLAAILDGGAEPIDRGLVTYFPEPSSYTGEDVAEISVHGSPVVVGRVLSALTRAGARLARPGEFTERAFLHGKLDLPRAEAVRDLIESRTAAAARFAARSLEGSLSRRFSSIQEDLLTAAASLGATIDFAEDVGEAVDEEVPRRLRSAASELSRLLATYETGRLLSAGCRVVVLGRPNAGKSTLFNALLGSARAIVTEVPGTTRDALEAVVDLAGVPVTLVDTAGLRETADVVERIGVERAREEAEKADAILYVLDAGRGDTPEDLEALEALRDRPVLRIANKIDQATPAQIAATGPQALPFCGLAPDAGARLREALAQEISARVDTESSSEVLASLRQRDLAERALAAAGRALDSLARGESPEYAASHVGDALGALADVLGETTAEDVLQRIFSTFCIGK
ncbi:MAG: tRNA uridine-5-carboxymethylaminomethyl(34) synthesis GTPase MnmE [Thermoanaerobaculia bacterium]